MVNRTPSAVAILAWVTASVLVADPARAQPEDMGPLAVLEWDAGRIDAAGARIPVVVYHPDANGPFPIVTVTHGNLRRGRVMRVTAETLASRGFVAIVPDMPCGAAGCDHDANANQLLALIDWAIASSGDATPIAGKVDASRRGMLGHSWGGLSTFIAGTRTQDVQAIVGYDPVDDVGEFQNIAGRLNPPSLHLMAEERGFCSGSDWRVEVAPLTPAPHLIVRVVGSGHCDPEDPSDAFCRAGCGQGDRSTSHLFRRYAVAFFGCILQNDPSMASWIGGSDLDSDQQSGALDGIAGNGLDQLPCRGGAMPSDAGVVEDAAPGAEDASPGPSDAGMAGSDTGAEGPEAGAAEDSGPQASIDAGEVADAGLPDVSDTRVQITDFEAEVKPKCLCSNASTSSGVGWLSLVAILFIVRRRTRR